MRNDPTATPAEILVTVTNFLDVLTPGNPRGGRITGFKMKMKGKHPHVSLKGEDIVVQRPGATIRFALAAPAKGGEKYFPIGITFVREAEHNECDEQRLGLLNFPQRLTRPDGLALSITDRYRDRPGAGRVRYKFSVVLQRGSDGKIGIIDPGIVHEDDH